MLISIEKEIEDSLPQFQELILSLKFVLYYSPSSRLILISFRCSNDERPTAEASAARKRLVEAFAHYDTAAKRIQGLPCARGSSQDRVQTAILTRANLFLQKNMFPLQVRVLSLTHHMSLSRILALQYSPFPNQRVKQTQGPRLLQPPHKHSTKPRSIQIRSSLMPCNRCWNRRHYWRLLCRRRRRRGNLRMHKF